MKGSQARVGLLTKLRRRVGFDRNELRRPADRVETCVMIGLVTAFLAGAPLLAVTANREATAANARAQHDQQQWRRVPAVLLEGTPASTSVLYESSTTIWARARWTADGATHVGEVPVPAGTRKGGTVRVWINRAGEAAGVPISRAQVADRVTAVTVFAPFALAVVLLTVAAIAWQVLERKRIAAWESAWESIEPLWSRRRQAPGP